MCKHKFQARFDRRWSTAINDVLTCDKDVTKIHGCTGEEPYLKEEIYVKDVCVRCGDTIKRER
jgi:hypothetical protein